MLGIRDRHMEPLLGSDFGIILEPSTWIRILERPDLKTRYPSLEIGYSIMLIPISMQIGIMEWKRLEKLN